MNNKIIRNISWVFIFLFIYQWCGIKTIYAVDTSVVVEIDSTILGSTKLNSYINSKIAEGYTKFYIKDGPPYQLDNSIIINKPNIEIKGASKTGTILLQSNPGVNSIVIEKDNVELASFKIDGSVGNDVINARNVNNVNIHDCVIIGSNKTQAILICDPGSYNKITGNTIYAGNGVALDYRNQINGQISGNDVYFGGMYFQEDEDLTIVNNTSTDSTSFGIKARLPGQNFTISGNVIKKTKESGIAVVSSTTDRYKGIKILNNIIQDTKYE